MGDLAERVLCNECGERLADWLASGYMRCALENICYYTNTVT